MWLILFWEILFFGFTAGEKFQSSRSNKEIVVAFSERPPFVFQDQNGALKGLDILIVENFAKKSNLKIKYKKFTGSLNAMLNREETFENVLMKPILG